MESTSLPTRGSGASLTGSGLTRSCAFSRRSASGSATSRLQTSFLYRPGAPDYAFCEVKGPGDRLRREQTDYFRALREATGRPVYTLTLAPVSL